jgi:hypothetical protein
MISNRGVGKKLRLSRGRRKNDIRIKKPSKREFGWRRSEDAKKDEGDPCMFVDAVAGGMITRRVGWDLLGG